MKKLYGVGTGPGDKKLLTLKAVEKIQGASVIFAPNNKGKNMALDTVEDYLVGKKIVYLDFPMGKVTRKDYIKGAEKIYKELPQEGYGVYLTIGDPMVYSTFIYLMEELEECKVQVEVIPGIPSFIAGAARNKFSLTVKGDRFLLVDDFQEDLLDHVDSLCILKTLRNKEEILNSLEKKGFNYSYIKRVGLVEEKIYKDRGDILEDKDYMSLILARKKAKD